MTFTPKLLGVLLSSPTAADTFTSNANFVLGASDGTRQGYVGSKHNDAINSVAVSANSASAILKEINETANATFGLFGSGSASISWDASGTAYLIPWWAVGDNAGGTKGTISGTGTISGAGTIQ